MKYILSLLLLLIIMIISVTLGMQNAQIVEFNFLIAKGTYSLPALLALLFGSGLVIGWLLTGVFYIRLCFKLKRNERKLNKLEQQLKSKSKSETPPLSKSPTSSEVIKG